MLKSFPKSFLLYFVTYASRLFSKSVIVRVLPEAILICCIPLDCFVVSFLAKTGYLGISLFWYLMGGYQDNKACLKNPDRLCSFYL